MLLGPIEMLEPSRKTTASVNSNRYSKPVGEEVRRLNHLLHVVDLFRAREPKMPISYMLGFLAVAMDPGKGPSDYARALGTIQPVMSRILLEIGKKARHRGESLGLVDYEQDPGNLRTHRYFLTQKGKLFYRDLMKVYEQYDSKLIGA